MKGIHEISELFIIRRPDMTIVAFGSEVVDIFEVNDIMSSKDWHLNALQRLNRVNQPVPEKKIVKVVDNKPLVTIQPEQKPDVHADDEKSNKKGDNNKVESRPTRTRRRSNNVARAIELDGASSSKDPAMARQLEADFSSGTPKNSSTMRNSDSDSARLF